MTATPLPEGVKDCQKTVNRSNVQIEAYKLLLTTLESNGVLINL